MELKQAFLLHGGKFAVHLLIVPYGIETHMLLAGGIRSRKLLIVPYGIETQ